MLPAAPCPSTHTGVCTHTSTLGGQKFPTCASCRADPVAYLEEGVVKGVVLLLEEGVISHARGQLAVRVFIREQKRRGKL